MAGRRMARDPDKDRWKQAIKLPKAAKPKKVGAPVPIGSSVKNVKTTQMGKTVGKFHLGKQDFNQIHTVHHGASKKKKLAALGKAKAEGSAPAFAAA
ncbi:unnamed protein product [Effrenium voratum]|nr:unnamed protein product [Effrenium voratum]